ncbi:DHA2 family efflux MFS transporter permease subunit [Leptospira wolffii]|uniref:multidrug transporter subunit MdtD n=1 Tax=Leptospira wolffii TaxID=409998 RepID=UPI001082B5E1|nr:multidrug transporter subunit MdtD [Leptospira wolffii]TGK56181.1 DHA2 family efflux MFS transporter permease subunit [Leptospira wolffii]TGK72227.1 DHA2 family efflux MFS transporter permease subunit [Leptospira wolffii]TGK72866.1 DHA2 family efflux MFS transporter permease subunit [Leptospira wolffii]TGL27804.1 DHA2 family efflux MFS transporter permease subunit [Leptospira wolffii]
MTTESKGTKALLWLVACGFFMQTLDSTIVNTALPAIARSLDTSPLKMQSVVVAYLLTMAMIIPASAWISDKFGVRRVFIGALALFVIGSLFCAASQNLTQLILSRIVQGMGGALLLPVGRLALLRSVPHDQFLQAISFVAIPGLIGPLIGPVLGGWLSESASWHWIFLINLPVGAVGILAAILYMKSDSPRDAFRFDAIGYALLAFGMVTFSMALDAGYSMGLKRAGVLLLLVFGLSSLTAYWIHAARSPRPLFSPKIFSVPTLSIGLLGNLFSRLGSSSMPFLVPLFLQVNMGYSPFRAGLMLLPMAIAGIGIKRFAPLLIYKLGYRNVLVLNTLLIGASMSSFFWIDSSGNWWFLSVQLFCFGAVNSLQFTAMNTLTLKDLEDDFTSSGNTMLSMVQMLAMGMGVALAAGVLEAFTDLFGNENMILAFKGTFACMGLVTLSSSMIFWQLRKEDGRIVHIKDSLVD